MKNSSMHEHEHVHVHVHDHEIKEDDVLKEMMACDDDHPNLNWDGDVVGELDREMWFERDQDEDLLINYDDFPPLPDFPTISSSSSSSCSNNLNPQTIKNSSSSNTTSSSSASSSSVTYAHDPALLSTGSGIPPAESGVGRLGSADYMDVMEELGGMDLLDSDDIWDPSTLFPCDGLDDVGFGKQEERIATDSSSPQEEKTTPSEDLAVLFFEWLKSNKESISAEDLRSIKLKRSTIECAAKRLGGGKEGMKQLLKLILEWVQNHQLQRKRIKERENSNSLFHQSNPNLNPNHNPGTDPYFLPPMPQQWIPQQPYNVPESTTIYPPMMYPYMGEAVYNPLPNQTVVHQSSWPPPSQHYAAFPEQNLAPTPPPSHVVPPSYAPFPNSYPCQVYPSPTDRLVRLGSSATKEARKKRMARQKRFFSHGRNHNHHNQQVIETRLANDANCTSTSQNPNWLYWPSSPSTSVSPSTMIVSEPPPPLMLQGYRQTMQSNDYQRQGSLDKRQGCKIGTEKNLKFLLQKVLKQSDVGSLGRIVLPKKEAETYLPGLEARDGISLSMEELGSSRIWNMRYRFWPNNKSRMYLLENTGEFVRSNGLQEGDFIVIYSDVKCGKYLIRGIKVRQSGSKTEAKRQGKMHRNFHANSSAALASASTSSKEMVR